MSVFCQKCQKEAANVHVTELSKEGGKLELHLCEECAKDHGMPTSQAPSMIALFKELMEKPTPGRGTRDRQCPQCGMSFGEFKAKGRFGCAHDYEVFLSRVIPLLERIHGASEHTGESDAARTEKTTAAEAAQELKRLRRDLERVIKSEEYEEAARIRDRIQHLERQRQQEGGAHA